MSKYNTCLVLLLVLFISITSIIGADDRIDPIDVFLIVDKSLSMEEEIGAVKNYINKSVVDEVLIPGDNFIVIVFYGKAEVLISGAVPENKDSIALEISRIVADGHFTDIGNALDTLRVSLTESGVEGRRKYLLLITDGIQEAPPESRYYSPDGSFNHEFLENTKEILKEGWKIHILGIGSATAAKEIAQELSGTYSEVSEAPSEEELADQTREFLGMVELQDSPSLAAVGKSGKSNMKIELASSGYSESREITIMQIDLQLPDNASQSLLDKPFTFAIPAEDTMSVNIPVYFQSIPEPGDYAGNVVFVFTGDTAFSPAVAAVEYRVKGFFGNNIWVFPVGAVALALLALLVLFLIKKLSGGGSISFICVIDDSTVKKRQYKLKYANKLYLAEGMMGLTIRESAGENPAAEISADGMGLHLVILDEKGYSTAEPIPDNVLPGEIVIVKKYGKKATISFTLQ